MSEQKWAVMCSMTGGWGVARPEHAYREEDGLLACTEWESLHDTWEEAMQEANRMARTVTVTLSTEEHQALDLSKVTRITVVGDAGKGLLFEDYHAYGHPHGPELSLQDDGKTLKILPTRTG